MVHKFTECFIIISLNKNNLLEAVVLFHRSMQTQGMTQFLVVFFFFSFLGCGCVCVTVGKQMLYSAVIRLQPWFKKILGLHVKIFQNLYQLFPSVVLSTNQVVFSPRKY